MQLHEISLENFRAKQSASLALGSRLTLLMGENGSGKTTFLDAIAIALSAVLTYLPDQNVKGIKLRDGDILQQGRRKFPYTLIRAKCTSHELIWDLMRKRDSTQVTKKEVPQQRKGLRGLLEYLDKGMIEPWNKGENFDLPVIAYYGVSRALVDVPERRRNFHRDSGRFAALAESLNATSRFRSAFIWICEKESEERSLRLDEKKDFNAKLPELEAVRQCIYKLLPGTSNLRTKTRPLRFLITHHGQELEMAQMSDGYKTMLGLAIDLGSRMASANPHLPDPLAAESIVLIDEVDLHLHPTWQQRVISDLLRTFPKTQFVLTSHSPILVESVNNVLKRHAIDHLLVKAPPEALQPEIKNLYPLDPQCARVYDMTKDSHEDLLDPEEGLAGDPLINGFNEVSALFNDMCDFEDDFESNDVMSTSVKEDTP